MLTDFRKTVLRHARYETDAISIGYYIGLYPLVCGVPFKLPSS